MSRSRLTLLTAALVGAFALASTPALAIPMPANAQLSFEGGIDPVGGTDVWNSTGWDFRASGLSSPGIPGSIKLLNVSQVPFTDFDALTCPPATAGGCGTVADLPMPLPVVDFITVTQGVHILTFDLTSLQVLQSPPVGSAFGTLTLSGFGVLRYSGFDDTLGQFTITAQGNDNQSFSGTLAPLGVPAVPEPATMLLLGAGLSGLFAIRRRKQS